MNATERPISDEVRAGSEARLSPDMFGRRGWSYKGQEEVRRHHRKLWEELKREWGLGRKDRTEWLPGFRDSVESLMDQDYSLSDISVFFGMSRERMRQLAVRMGLRDRAVGRGSECSSKLRVFDWELQRFVSVGRQDVQSAVRQRRESGREHEKARRLAEVRAALVTFAAEHGRPPSLTELSRAIQKGGGSNPVVSLMWYVAPNGNSPYSERRQALHAVYAEAGFLVPSGHQFRRPRFSARRAANTAAAAIAWAERGPAIINVPGSPSSFDTAKATTRNAAVSVSSAEGGAP